MMDNREKAKTNTTATQMKTVSLVVVAKMSSTFPKPSSRKSNTKALLMYS